MGVTRMTHNVVPETVVNQPGIPDVEPAPAFAGVDIRRCTPPGVASPASSLMPAVLALHQTRQPAQIWPLEPFTSALMHPLDALGPPGYLHHLMTR